MVALLDEGDNVVQTVSTVTVTLLQVEAGPGHEFQVGAGPESVTVELGTRNPPLMANTVEGMAAFPGLFVNVSGLYR